MFHFIPVRLEDLRLKLERDGLIVSFLVVNHQGQHSQLKYPQLREKVSTNIPVYQQDSKQPDVWTALNGRKDDFLIYDRCGRLVYHLGLPYSFLSFPYVEEAIRITYCESKCGNCSYLTSEDEDLCRNLSKASSDETLTEAARPSAQDQLSPHGHHGHGHHRHGHHPPQNNRGRNREGQAGSQEIVDAPPQGRRN
ncbi:Selenoprotein P [Varanus komodoensis]|nr:Selenoprotein P [Varanus komodoensis]